MALSDVDLMRLELHQRLLADRLRKEWPREMVLDPATPAGMRLYAEKQRRLADDYQAVADMLLGLQGDWANLGPRVRAGYNRMGRAERVVKKLEAESAV